MSDAFSSAWESVKSSGDPQMVDGKAEWARETLALRIIDKAQAGERDVIRLRDDALEHLAIFLRKAKRRSRKDEAAN